MRFCGPNFRKTALFATVNASSPHGIHTAKLVFFYIFRTTLWTHATILHDEQIRHQSYNSTLDFWTDLGVCTGVDTNVRVYKGPPCSCPHPHGYRCFPIRLQGPPFDIF